MTSTPPSPTGEPLEPLGYDPAEGLALLSQSRKNVVVDQQLDFGPWWYVPVLALFYAAVFAWMVSGTGATVLVCTALAVAGLCGVIAHDRRRRGVRPGWPSPLGRSGRGTTIFLVMSTVLNGGLIIGSGEASRWFRSQESASLLALSLLMWIFATAVLSITRFALHRERDRVLSS